MLHERLQTQNVALTFEAHDLPDTPRSRQAGVTNFFADEGNNSVLQML